MNKGLLSPNIFADNLSKYLSFRLSGAFLTLYIYGNDYVVLLPESLLLSVRVQEMGNEWMKLISV